jgi:segregation and condensation protein A
MSNITTNKPYQVKLPDFEGPLDLLLYLIKQQEIDIYDIPIARITAEYWEYLGLMQELNLEIAGEFLVMAATLIHIKSQMLLPRPEIDVLTGEVLEDPRTELVQRLLEHQQFKQVAQTLWQQAEVMQTVFPRACLESDKQNPEVAVSSLDLILAFKKLLERQKQQTAVLLAKEQVSVAETIKELLNRLQQQPTLALSPLLAATSVRREAITLFLAVLELVKSAQIFLTQDTTFGEIFLQARQSFSNTNEMPLATTEGGKELENDNLLLHNNLLETVTSAERSLTSNSPSEMANLILTTPDIDLPDDPQGRLSVAAN